MPKQHKNVIQTIDPATLGLIITIPEVMKILPVNYKKALTLAKSEGFGFRCGKQIFVHRDKLITWINNQTI